MTIGLDATSSGLGTKIAAGAGGLVLLVAVLAAGAGAGIASLLGGGDAAPSATATSDIPPAMLALYQEAAATCPGLPWTVLAAIGTVESDNDQSTLPGVHSGANSAGAEGPMQFEPATFAAIRHPCPARRRQPAQPVRPDRRRLRRRPGPVRQRRRERRQPLRRRLRLQPLPEPTSPRSSTSPSPTAQTEAQTVAAGTAGGIAVDWALAQVGTPYIWGGETPGVGFDCSGLVQAAYKVAGITLPRVAQDQYDATAKLGPGDPLEPGDLVFFGGGPTDVTHVGIYIGNGQMVDAPHTGADVRVESIPTTLGAPWGTDIYVGATQPAVG